MARGEKGKPIKGLPASRDKSTGAVVFNDTAGYQRAIKRKRAGRHTKAQARLVAKQQAKIIDLEKRLENSEFYMKQVLKDIVKLKKDVGNPGGGNPN